LYVLGSSRRIITEVEQSELYANVMAAVKTPIFTKGSETKLSIYSFPPSESC